MFHYSEPVLEADDRTLIEAKQVAGVLAEAARTQIAGEAMRQSEIASVNGKRECGREIDKCEVGFRRPQLRVVVGFLRASGRGGGNGQDRDGYGTERTDRERVSNHNGTSIGKLRTTVN
jgi:hypothetical protein